MVVAELVERDRVARQQVSTLVQAQLWYRDPHSTSNRTTSLSDAIEFQVGP